MLVKHSALSHTPNPIYTIFKIILCLKQSLYVTSKGHGRVVFPLEMFSQLCVPWMHFDFNLSLKVRYEVFYLRYHVNTPKFHVVLDFGILSISVFQIRDAQTVPVFHLKKKKYQLWSCTLVINQLKTAEFMARLGYT
jgi:hypothetical protein